MITDNQISVDRTAQIEHSVVIGTREAETEMSKMVTRYEIRAYSGASYSRSVSPKLKARNVATKLVRRLRKRGIDAFAAPIKIAA